MTMMTKACSVFMGFSSGEFEGESGDKVRWCNAAFSVPGTADTFILKVDQDEVDPKQLKPYRANYLLIDFRYDSKFKNWKGVIVEVFASKADFDAATVSDSIPPELFDDPADAKAAAIAAASRKEA